MPRRVQVWCLTRPANHRLTDAVPSLTPVIPTWLSAFYCSRTRTAHADNNHHSIPTPGARPEKLSPEAAERRIDEIAEVTQVITPESFGSDRNPVSGTRTWESKVEGEKSH